MLHNRTLEEALQDAREDSEMIQQLCDADRRKTNVVTFGFAATFRVDYLNTIYKRDVEPYEHGI